VIVKHFGNGVLLLPIEDPWQTLEAGLAAFEPGFLLSREQPVQHLHPHHQRQAAGLDSQRLTTRAKSAGLADGPAEGL
jgi:hypothetical protein